MTDYIKNWKAEHLAIMNLLTSAVKLDICSKAGQEKMREAKNALLAHLRSEDEVLYPMVKKVARNKVSIERLLEIFTKEMEELAPKVSAFYKEYEDNPTAKELSPKLNKLIELLRFRIGREENIFIKEYENAISQPDDEKKAL